MLPNGEKIKHITVGGRTSAIVESRQKKIKINGDEIDEDVKIPPQKNGKKVTEEVDAKEKPVRSKSARKSNGTEEAVKRKMKVEEGGTTPKKRRAR